MNEQIKTDYLYKDYRELCESYHAQFPPETLQDSIDNFREKLDILGNDFEYNFIIQNNKVYLRSIDVLNSISKNIHIIIPDFVFGIFQNTRIIVPFRDAGKTPQLEEVTIEFNRTISIYKYSTILFSKDSTEDQIESDLREYKDYIEGMVIKRLKCHEDSDVFMLFKDLQSIKKLNLVNFDNRFILSCTDMFSDLGNVLGQEITIDLGEKFTFENIVIADDMFAGNEKLKILFGNNKNPEIHLERALIIDALFEGVGTLDIPGMSKTNTSLNLSNFYTRDAKYMTSMFYRCGLKELNFGDNFGTSNVINMAEMFAGCTRLRKITFGKKFKTSNVVNMTRMFAHCNELKHLDLSMFDTRNVTHMPGMFLFCTKLQGINFGERFKTTQATRLSNMFKACQNLEELDLSKVLDTSNTELMDGMFSNCIKLRKINLGPNFDTYKVIDINSLFDNCSELEDVDFGDKFNLRRCLNITSMFLCCEKLKHIRFGDNLNTYMLNSMNSVFRGCRSLEEVDFGNNFYVDNLLYTNYLFDNCRRLQKVRFGKNFRYRNMKDRHKLTALNLFYRCTALKELDFEIQDKEDRQDVMRLLHAIEVDEDLLNSITIK